MDGTQTPLCTALHPSPYWVPLRLLLRSASHISPRFALKAQVRTQRKGTSAPCWSCSSTAELTSEPRNLPSPVDSALHHFKPSVAISNRLKREIFCQLMDCSVHISPSNWLTDFFFSKLTFKTLWLIGKRDGFLKGIIVHHYNLLAMYVPSILEGSLH